MQKKAHVFNLKMLIAGCAAIVLLMAMFLMNAVRVNAEEGFQLFTPFQKINVDAGSTVSYDLYIGNQAHAENDITLSVESIPENFVGHFHREGKIASIVHSTRDDDDDIGMFQVVIPKDAEQGTYEILLKAVADSGEEDDLLLTLEIASLDAGESNFIVDYPEQQGASGTNFAYTTTLANNTLYEQNYTFSSDAPEGWNVTFSLDEGSTYTTSAKIESGKSKTVSIAIEPPQNVPAGDYEIHCTASSATEQATNTLKIKVLGKYSVFLGTYDGKVSKDVQSNEVTEMKLKVVNNGNITLENIELSTSVPTSNWEITFDQNMIESLEAGATKEVTAYIKPASDALTGDYMVFMNATSKLYTDSLELRLTVKTPTGWGVFAVVIILGVIAGLWFVMKKYGRR